MSDITLHEEIAAILRERGNEWMHVKDIAAEVNRRQNYEKKDISKSREVSSYQIRGRVKNYPHLFEQDGQLARLRDNT